MEFKIDIEVYDTDKNKWAQAKYLVHGYDDVYWYDDFMSVRDCIMGELIRYENGEIPD